MFVCRVGDDGGKDNYAIKNLEAGATMEFIINKGQAGNLRFSAWYSEDDRVQLNIEKPNGQIEGPFNPPSNAAGVEDEFLDEINIYHRGADAEFFNSSSNIRLLMIDFFDEQGVYKVSFNSTTLNTDGKINGLLNPAIYYNANAFLNNDNPGGNINSFSSCLHTLSPGDYFATYSFTVINNVDRELTGQGEPGELWLGLSIGPTLDGRLGIDFVASGEIAHAAYSTDSYYGSFDFNVLQNSNGNYGIQTTVSTVAPLSAGVIALILEANPSLTPEQIKSIIQSTAREDAFTGTTPNNRFGHGKLDALAAVEKAMEFVTTKDIKPSFKKLDVAPNPFFNELSIRNIDLQNEVKDFIIYDLLGHKLYELKDELSNTFSPPNLKSGTYFFSIKTGDQIYLTRVVKM